jgi:hypothetical protein
VSNCDVFSTVILHTLVNFSIVKNIFHRVEGDRLHELDKHHNLNISPYFSKKIIHLPELLSLLQDESVQHGEI